MDRDRLKEVRQTDLTESRVNEDFVDWLKNKGLSWLLFALLGICAYLAVVRFKQHRLDTTNSAWAAMFEADLPKAFEDVAAEHGKVGQIANLARVRAADKLLDAIQTGTTIDAPVAQRGSTTPPALLPEHILTPEQRTQYLDRADALYGEVIAKDNGKPGLTLYMVSAMNGRAAIAESRGDAAAAKEWYEKAAQRASFYPGLAEQAEMRAETASEFTQPVEFRTELELRSLGGNAAPTTPIRIDSALRELILPDEDGN